MTIAALDKRCTEDESRETKHGLGIERNKPSSVLLRVNGGSRANDRNEKASYRDNCGVDP